MIEPREAAEENFAEAERLLSLGKTERATVRASLAIAAALLCRLEPCHGDACESCVYDDETLGEPIGESL